MADITSLGWSSTLERGPGGAIARRRKKQQVSQSCKSSGCGAKVGGMNAWPSAPIVVVSETALELSYREPTGMATYGSGLRPSESRWRLSSGSSPYKMSLFSKRDRPALAEKPLSPPFALPTTSPESVFNRSHQPSIRAAVSLKTGFQHTLARRRGNGERLLIKSQLFRFRKDEAQSGFTTHRVDANQPIPNSGGPQLPDRC